MGNVDGYQQDGVRKTRFHQISRKILRNLAQDLNLPKNSFDIRSNMAGPAVSGEITLHAEGPLYSLLHLYWLMKYQMHKDRRL